MKASLFLDKLSVTAVSGKRQISSVFIFDRDIYASQPSANICPPEDVCRRGTCAQCQYSFWAKVIIVSNLNETSAGWSTKVFLGRRGNTGIHLSDQKLTEITTELNCPSPVDNSTHKVIGSMKNYLRKARMFERVASRITFFLKRASLNSKKSFSPPAFMGLPNRSFMRYKRNIKRDPQLNETLTTSKTKSSRSSS